MRRVNSEQTSDIETHRFQAARSLYLVHSRGYSNVMDIVTVSQFQQQPDLVLARVQAGESLLIVRDGRTVAELRPASAPPGPRSRGRCGGMFCVPDDFDAPLPEEVLREFEGR